MIYKKMKPCLYEELASGGGGGGGGLNSPNET